MTAPYPAAAGVALLNDVNERWPNRSKASDGWIGDAAHAASTSDHNALPNGAVIARDFTAEGIDTDVLIAAAKRDPRTNYIIHDRQIMFYDDGFIPHPYNGVNAHRTHVHISFRRSPSYYDNGASWNLNPPATPKDADMPSSRVFARTDPQPLKVNTQEWVRLSNDGQKISAEFGARRFDTTLQLYFDGLPANAEVQVQAVRVDSAGKVLHSYGTQGATGDTGGVFRFFSWKGDLPAGTSLRFYVKVFKEGVRITTARATTHAWAL